MGCCDQTHPDTETCPACGFDPFVRNHFFTGKMMGAGDFAAETHYHSEKMRHHNVRLHGAGTVCGLEVKQHPSPECVTRFVVVKPGSALDCCGHEILVADDEYFEVVRHPDVVTLANDSLLHTLQICVSWRECGTEQVPVLYDDCGCDEDKCAPNRVLESYQVDLRVDPPLGPVESAHGAALGAFIGTDRHGVSGYLRAADGRIAFIDPEDATRLVILDARRHRARSVTLPAAARAVALAADGLHVFVVVAPVAPATTCEVRVYAMVDATEVPPVAAARAVPGTDAGSVLEAVAGTGARTLIVYVASTGTAHVWPADATVVIPDAPADSHGLDAGLTALAANEAGDRLYGIRAADAAGNRRVRGYALGATVVTTDYSATDRATALAVFRIGAAPDERLAIASAEEKRVHIMNPGVSPPTAITVDLAHPPESIGVTGSGTDAWLQVVEIEGSQVYQQAVRLGPLATNGTPQVSAARLAGSTPNYLVALFADGFAGIFNPAAFADGDCADLLWRQLRGCPSCDMGDCVVLATLANYRPGMEMLDPGATSPSGATAVARIDNRLGRRILASTATLQAWLECLELSGGTGETGPQGPQGPQGDQGPEGPQGPPGPGLETGLTRIVALSWLHAHTHDTGNDRPTVPLTLLVDGAPIPNLPDNFRFHAFVIGFSAPVVVPTQNEAVPIIEFMVPQPIQAQAPPIVSYLWRGLLGLLLPITSFTATAGRITSAVLDVPSGGPVPAVAPALAFIPVIGGDNGLRNPFLPGLNLIRLRGDFVLDTVGKGRAIDAEFTRGRLPTGDRPEGDDHGIQGGTFESWFRVGNEDPRPTGNTGGNVDVVGSHLRMAVPSVNSASPLELMSVPGMSPAAAASIVAARGSRRKAYKRAEDLHSVAGLDNATLVRIKNHLRFD